MEITDSQLKTVTAHWPKQAQDALTQCRDLFQTIAQETETAPLDETPKWRQPSWRPTRPRTGSTLRLNWSTQAPTILTAYVDCKTDLAARMADLYPAIPNDRSRALIIDLNKPLPKDMLCHLAALTFTYHRKPRS